MALASVLILSHPGLLLGVVAIALPLLIHLVLRPRPRRTRFPAIVLLHAALVSGQRANRLRNLVLLAVRAGLLALAALLLAAPTCAPTIPGFVGSAPVACAVVLDDSASMSYRLDDGTTLLELARREALDFIAASGVWPAGSALTVLNAGLDESGLAWSTDRASLAETLGRIARPADHARPLGAALRAAADRLRTAGQTDRRAVVFTDGAAHAWRDVSPAVFAGVERLGLRVVLPDKSPRSNLAVTAAVGPTRLYPATAELPLGATLAAAGIDSQAWLLVQADERTLRRLGPLAVPAAAGQEVELSLPAMEPGPHALKFQLEPADRMNFDQQRFVSFQTSPRPVVWLVSQAAKTSTLDVTALILRNLLAPDVLPAAQQLVEVHPETAESAAAALTDGAAIPPPTLIIVLSGVTWPPAAAPALRQCIERGSSVLLVPDPSDPQADWPELRPRLTPAAPEDEPISPPLALHWEPASAYASSEELAELTRCAVHRRIRLGALREEVEVAARYSDDVPAIVSIRIGAGRLFALTTSPDPQWSDLGIRAAGLITWLHQLVDDVQGPPTAAASFLLGEPTRHRFAVLPPGGLVRVSLTSTSEAPPTWMRIADGVPDKPWPTDRAGIYAVSAAGAPTATYVVNWPPEESQLVPISLDELRSCTGDERAALDVRGGTGSAAQPTLFERIFAGGDLRRPLAAALLIVFALEMLLATRRPTKIA